MLCFLFDVFSLEVKSRPKMRWITKEELQRDLNELLPDKDVCDLILLELLHWHLPLSTHMIRYKRACLPRAFQRPFVHACCLKISFKPMAT